MNHMLAERRKDASGEATQASQQGDAWLSETDLLRTEIEALRRQNLALRETLDAIDGTIVVYDQERRYLFGNQQYHAVYPHLPAEGELIGLKYEDVLALSIAAGTVDDPAAYTDTASFIARRVDDMERRSLSPVAQIAPPGRESLHPQTGRWSLVRSRRTPSGNDVSLRVDISAQKELQHALQQAREAAETASQMKSQFLGNVSHELRTPLNAVINFARLIADQIHGPLGAPQYREYARDIAESGTHLLTLIDDLLDLARAEAGRLAVVESNVDTSRLIATACRVLEPEAIANGIALTHAIGGDVSYMRGDATRLRQVLFNLIANAIKFTRAGGTVHVEAACDATGGLQVRVSDTGIGIAAPDLAYVMEPFAQVARPSGTSCPGVGLGLPLSRRLIELHGGSLALESTPGIGTTAVIRIPSARMISPA